jgi:hypothetical protein
MRGLAEFIMRGRWQALGVAVLGSGSLLFGWVSAAAIALVTLRNGSASGGWLTLWAILPAIIIAAISGDTGSVLLLLGTFSLAVILRESCQSFAGCDGKCAPSTAGWRCLNTVQWGVFTGASSDL